MAPIRGHASRGKSINAYPVGVSVKSNGSLTVIIISDGACDSAEHWRVTSTPDKEAIGANDCRDGCRCKELCPHVTPSFHSRGDEKIVKEEMNDSFWAMIVWSDVRRLVLKLAESKKIDAPAGPLTIVEFSAAVQTVVSRGRLGVSAQHVPE